MGNTNSIERNDDEPTQPIPVESLAELAAAYRRQWAAAGRMQQAPAMRGADQSTTVRMAVCK